MLRASAGFRPLLIERPVLIQPYDIDFAGHVNNAVYVRWLEDWRMALLAAYCPLQELMKEGMAPVVAETTIHYRRPLHLFDTAVGRMWCTTLGRATLALEAEITVGDAVHTRASQRIMLVNVLKQKPMRTPEALRSAFSKTTNG